MYKKDSCYVLCAIGQALSNISHVVLVAKMVKNMPAMQNTWVQSLHREYPLKKDMATHSNILVWRIPWTEEPGRLQIIGLQRVRQTEVI